MPDFKVGPYEDLNKKKSGLISTLLTVILILLLFQPLFTDIEPQPPQSGITVLLGSVEQKRGSIKEPVKQPEKVKKQKVVKKEVKKSPSKSRSKKTIVTEDPDAIRIKREKEKKKREKAKKRKEEKEAREAKEAKRIAEAEKKREMEEAEKRAKALSFGEKGEATKSGEGTKAIGIGTGNDEIGGGLGGRGVISAPKITDNSQDAGVVLVKVCVDRNGDVIQAEIRQTKTTTTSSRLKKIALEGARSYKFKKDLSAPKKQCGTITVDFKMK